MADDFLTAGQVAELLGVTAGTVHRWTEAGVIPAGRTVGGHRRYLRADVERAMRERQMGRLLAVEPRRMLLVENGNAITLELQRLLSGYEQALKTVSNGQEVALEMDRFHPDMVVLDLELNGTEGVRILQNLRRRWPGVDLLVVTEYSNTKLLLRALDFSPFHIVKKPLRGDTLRMAVQAGSRASAGGPAAAEDRLRILIVDDDEMVRSGLEKELGAMPEYAVRTAGDGYRAGRLLTEFRPHLMILDLLMEGLDGFDVCLDVKSSPTLRETRILVLTGYPGGGNVARIERCGADRVLVKPVTAEELRAEITRLCGRSGAGPASGG